MRKILLLWATLCALTFLCVAQVAAAELTIKGRLAPTTEAGGWLVVTGKQKYLLLNAERWRKESWFRADAEVEATGEIKKDAITIYMEGTPFEARTLRPTSSSSEGAGDGAAAQEVTGGT